MKNKIEKNELDNFIKKLQSLRYNINKINEFLNNQDYNMPIESILTIENFCNYCKSCNINPLEDGVTSLNYQRLDSVKETIFNDEGKELIQNMLTVWDDKSSIIVCHPNHLFRGEKLISPLNREIVNLNWLDIDIERMFRINDLKHSLYFRDTFTYAHNRLRNEIMREVKKGNKEVVSYLAVVEQIYISDECYTYLVRGIIRGDYRGYSLAFNPDYEKRIPKSIWEKSLRITGNYK